MNTYFFWLLMAQSLTSPIQIIAKSIIDFYSIIPKYILGLSQQIMANSLILKLLRTICFMVKFLKFFINW